MGIKVRKAQTNFIRGEYQPEMFGRYDLYANGAEKLENMALLIQGGVRTRPPLRYLATLNQNEGKMFAFVFNDEQRYAFVFSNARLDIYQESTGWTALTPITSAPWTTAMLTRLSVTHDGDTMIVFHPDMPMQVIKRTAATTFTRSAYAFEENSAGDTMYQPYYKFAAADMTLTVGGTTGSQSLTLSGAGAFTSDHVGFIIRREEEEILITAVTDANNATGTCRQTLTAATATTDWDEAVFSDERGYAHHGEFHNNRLWILGSRSRPKGRWFTKIGAFFNFDLGTQQDNEASWEGVISSRMTELRYGVSTRHMVMFGDTGSFLQPESQSVPITPDNANSIEQDQIGTAYVKPAVYDGGIVFVHKEGRSASEMRYNDVDQAYVHNPMSHTAGHLINSPTALSVLHDSPNRQEKYCLLCNSDGNLSVLHSNERENILGWTPWSTDGDFKDVCAIGKDVLAIVERDLNSSTVWTLEVFDDDIPPLDCAQTVTPGGTTKTFSGFAHLLNETVNVVTNGHSLGTYTVSGAGVITLGDLDPEVTSITAGKAYEQRIKPMPAVYDLATGETRGQVVGLVRTHIETDRAGTFAYDGQTILLSFAGDDFTTAAPTKTGIITVPSLGYDENAAREIVIADPIKVTVLGITREVEVNG